MATLAHDVAAERERSLALGAALLTVTLWASAFVGIRSAGRDLSPGALALGRLLVNVGPIVIAILAGFVLHTRGSRARVSPAA